MTDKLKSCPFCGSTELRGHNYVNRVFEACYEIFCLNCDAIIRGYTESEAIAAWNSRVESDTLPTWAIEAIEEVIENQTTELSVNLVESQRIYIHAQREALNWGLSLRKPEEK